MKPRYSVTCALAALALVACATAARPPTLTSAPLFVPPLKTMPTTNDPLAVRFPEGASPPSGCFALSRRSGAVACVVGHHRVGSESGERYLSLLSSGDDALPNVPVHVRPTETGPRLEPESRRMLDAIMVEGDYIALGPPIMLPPDAPRTFGAFTVELRREEIRSAPYPMWDLAVLVRLETDDPDAGASDPLLVNTLTAVSCAEPTISVRILEPTRVLVERECRSEDGGEPEVMIGAWLCDGERSRCD